MDGAQSAGQSKPFSEFYLLTSDSYSDLEYGFRGPLGFTHQFEYDGYMPKVCIFLVPLLGLLVLPAHADEPLVNAWKENKPKIFLKESMAWNTCKASSDCTIELREDCTLFALNDLWSAPLLNWQLSEKCAGKSIPHEHAACMYETTACIKLNPDGSVFDAAATCFLSTCQLVTD